MASTATNGSEKSLPWLDAAHRPRATAKTGVDLYFKRYLTYKNLRTLSLFVLIPGLGAVSPLLALPALTHKHGSEAWADVAFGMAIGSAAAVIVEMGWGLSGPQRIARASLDRSLQYLRLSLKTKMFAFLPTVSAGLFIGLLYAPYDGLLAALSIIGSSLTGFTTNWFFIGRTAPHLNLWLETFPRLVLTLMAALWLYLGGPAFAYPTLALIVPAALGPVLALVYYANHGDARLSQGWSNGRILKVAYFQGRIVRARAYSAAYMTLPTVLVGILAPTSLPAYAAIDRVQRMLLTLLSAVPNVLQGWVGRASRKATKVRRADAAIIACLGLGVCAGTAFGLLLPVILALVFSSTITYHFIYSVLSGLLILVVCVSRATGNIGLVAIRNFKAVERSSFLGAFVGIPVIAMLAVARGASGALLGVVVAELIVLIVQIVAYLRSKRL